MSKCVLGQDLHVFVGGVSIAMATSHTFSLSGETISCVTKDNGGGEWASNEMGVLSFEMTTENLVASERNGKSFDDLYDLFVKKQPVELIFTTKSTIADKGSYYEVPEGGWKPSENQGYKGKALITSLSMNAAVSEHATFSATFTGTGALEKLNTAAVMSLNQTSSVTKTAAAKA